MSTRFLHYALTSLFPNKVSFPLLYQSHAFKGITFKIWWGHPVILIHLNRKYTQTPTKLELVVLRIPNMTLSTVLLLLPVLFYKQNMETSSVQATSTGVLSDTWGSVFELRLSRPWLASGLVESTRLFFTVISTWRLKSFYCINDGKSSFRCTIYTLYI